MIEIERVSELNTNCFFGYYDLSPENECGDKVLINKPPFIDKMPKENDELEIGYYDLALNKYVKIGKTTAWNYQEGCRMQWVDNKTVIYNSRKNNKFISNLYDIELQKIIKEYEIPIYSVCSHKNIAISYDFINNKYFYYCEDKDKYENICKDGVYLLDLNTGSYKKILGIDYLAKKANTQKFRNWVEHCVFSPNGNNFFVFHRWDDNINLQGNHLCISDLNGTVETLLISKFISHAGWRNDTSLTSWCRLPNKLNSIQRLSFINNLSIYKKAKKIYNNIVVKPEIRQKITNDAYVLFDIKDNVGRKIENSFFTSDGHCSWSKDGRFMLTDTYPDKKDERMLMLYDYRDDKIINLGKYYSYPDNMKLINNEWNISSLRCDLHPKWSKSNKYIYFDSVHEGFRGLYRIKIQSMI